jgi:hypothetical protein
MKSIISKTITLVAIAATLLSFSSKFSPASPVGGEGFEISLNGKIVLQQFGKDLDNVKTLQLSSASPNDKLTIRYHHCGKVGKNRIVTIKDEQNKLVKEWRFNDASTVLGNMSCSVQDIISLKKGSNNVFKIYYSSSELPNGRQLASVIVANTNKVQP